MTAQNAATRFTRFTTATPSCSDCVANAAMGPCADCGGGPSVVGWGNPPIDICQACFDKRLARVAENTRRLREIFAPLVKPE